MKYKKGTFWRFNDDSKNRAFEVILHRKDYILMLSDGDLVRFCNIDEADDMLTPVKITERIKRKDIVILGVLCLMIVFIVGAIK